MLKSIFFLLEILLFYLAAYGLFKHRDYTHAEALASAIIVVLGGYSLLLQTLFLLHVPDYLIFFEAPLLVVAAIWLTRNRLLLRELLCSLQRIYQLNPVIISIIGIFWLYLLAQAIFLPPSNWDSMTYNLARVLLFHQEKTLLLESVTTYRQAIFPVGSDILSYLVLRFHNDFGIGFYSFSAYTAILLSLYAIISNRFSRDIALWSVIIVGGIPELVYQATSTKNDILCAAVAVWCLMMLNRFIREPRQFELVLLIMGLAFGLSAKTTFIAFTLPFIVALLYLLLKLNSIPNRTRTHQATSGAEQLHTFLRNIPIKRCMKAGCICLIPILFLSQSWLYLNNVLHWGGMFNPSEYQHHKNNDGLVGAIANLVRYFFQSIHPLRPIDLLVHEITGYWFRGGLQRVYEILFMPLWGNAGSFRDFVNLWIQNEDHSWFGPFGFLLIIPGLLVALFREESVTRVAAITAISYLLIICYKIAWMQWNNRFFTLFFVVGGVCMPPLLAWSFRYYFLKRMIKAAAIMVFGYSCFSNDQKPFYPFIEASEDTTNNIWSATNWGRNRDYYADRRYGDQRLTIVNNLIPADVRVGLLTDGNSWIYPFLLARRDVTWVPLDHFQDNRDQEKRSKALHHLDYVLILSGGDNRDLHKVLGAIPAEIIWQSAPAATTGMLLRL